MNKLVTTLSIIGFLGVSNVSFAGSGGFFYPFIPNKNKIEPNKSNESVNKSSESENKDSYATLLKFQSDYEQNRLQFNYIFGLCLDFGNGNLSIESLEEEMKNKVKASKKKEEIAFKNTEESEGNKLWAKTIREVWEKFAKKVSEDNKRLLAKQITLENLREQYTEKATSWFISQYGVKDKKENNNSDASSNTESESIKKSPQNNK
jgi:hypothetical protein